MTFRPSTAPRWKIATRVFFPFVVAASAIRTNTLGNSPPATSARPDDLKNVLRFIMGGVSLSLEFGTAEDQRGDRRDLGVVPRVLGRRLALDDARLDRLTR